MEIGKPVGEVPASQRGKFLPVWTAAKDADGKWVPVTFLDIKDAQNLASNQTHARHRGFEMRRHGLTVYVRYVNGKRQSDA